MEWQNIKGMSEQSNVLMSGTWNLLSEAQDELAAVNPDPDMLKALFEEMITIEERFQESRSDDDIAIMMAQEARVARADRENAAREGQSVQRRP